MEGGTNFVKWAAECSFRLGSLRQTWTVMVYAEPMDIAASFDLYFIYLAIDEIRVNKIN
jgi:hypothetical protein